MSTRHLPDIHDELDRLGLLIDRFLRERDELADALEALLEPNEELLQRRGCGLNMDQARAALKKAGRQP